jgi:chemosensory pili system protein ChpA (sensor histidine kinase/response regulator)
LPRHCASRRRQSLDTAETVGGTTDVRKVETGAVEPPMLAAATGASAIAATLPDPDLIRLFMEEAREELVKIEHHYPIWEQNPLESDSLLIVRRSFHTLKGSGRMVNARNISEFAWSIENLLNRLVEGTLPRSPAVLETLRGALDVLPKLVAELDPRHTRPHRRDSTRRAGARTGRRPGGRAARCTAGDGNGGSQCQCSDRSPRGARAWRTAHLAASIAAEHAALAARGKSLRVPFQIRSRWGTQHSSLEIDSVNLEALLDPVKIPEGLIDPPDDALRDIYARETASHVGTVRRWLARERQSSAPHVLPEEIYRACHTLVGSSTMAEARHGIRLAEPMNHWLRKSYDSGVGLDDSDLSLVGDCMTAMESVAGHLDEGTGFFVVHDTLRGRIARAELDLDRRIAESTQSASRTGSHLPR